MSFAVDRRTRESQGGFRSRPRLVAAASLAYVLSTAVGMVMRLIFVGLDAGLPFDHLLHAHSHTLYFGWAAVGVLVGAIDTLSEHGDALTRTAWALALVFPFILAGFLAFGYNPVTIAVSTMVMVGWYAAAWLWWRSSRGAGGIVPAVFRAAFGYLVAASGGVWVLGYLQASGMGTALSETLSVHAFLLGFAWFLVFGVVGMTLANAGRLGLDLDEEVARRALRWWVPLAFFTFPLGVTGGPEVAGLGHLARGAGLLLLYPAWLWTSALWKGARGAPGSSIWRVTTVWFATSAVGTGIVAVFGSRALDLAGRQGVVVYLHVLLVGFVTTALFALLPRRKPHSGVLTSHNVALGVMLIGLVGVSAGSVEAGYWIAAVGAMVLWCVGVVWAVGRLAEVAAARRR